MRSKPGCKSSKKEEADRERKRRTNRMLIAMVAIFGLSWLPLNLINLLNDINKTTGDWYYYNLAFFAVHAVAMSSTCYNPFLYAWLNDNFRKEFKQVSAHLGRCLSLLQLIFRFVTAPIFFLFKLSPSFFLFFSTQTANRRLIPDDLWMGYVAVNHMSICLLDFYQTSITSIRHP